jgi:hypothetical protein
MIGKMIGMFVGRRAKAQAVDAVLDKVNLPDPVENAIKVAVTGNVGDLLGGAGKDTAKEAVLASIIRKVKKK